MHESAHADSASCTSSWGKIVSSEIQFHLHPQGSESSVDDLINSGEEG